MIALIASIAGAAILLYYLGEYVRSRFQTVETAVDRVYKDLYRMRTSDEALVVNWSKYPLSETMIAKVARDDGWTYRGVGTSGGAGGQLFAPPKKPKRKLRISDV